MLRKLFLNPLAVFLGIWVLQVACYRLNIARFMPQEEEAYLALAKLFTIAASSFFGAYLLAGFLARRMRLTAMGGSADAGIGPEAETTVLGVNVINLRCVMFAILVMVAVLDYTNYLSYGPMPLMSSLEMTEADQSYIGYGRLNYVLYGAMFALILLTHFEPWWFLRWGVRMIYIAQCLMGLGRANLIVGLLQGFAILVLLDARTVPGARRGRALATRGQQSLLIGSIAVAIAMVFIMGVLGEIRTGNDIFKVTLQIRPEYLDTPTGFLWVVGYISFPLANMINLELWRFHDFTLGQATLFPLAPPILWGPLGLTDYPERYISVVSTYYPNPLNNVATYQSNAYLDAGIWGIVAYNAVLGFVASYMVRAFRRGLTRTGQLFYVIFLSRFFLIFFADTLFNALTIVEISILAFAGRWMWEPVRIAAPGAPDATDSTDTANLPATDHEQPTAPPGAAVADGGNA